MDTPLSDIDPTEWGDHLLEKDGNGKLVTEDDYFDRKIGE